jgi:hypothetical protein
MGLQLARSGKRERIDIDHEVDFFGEGHGVEDGAQVGGEASGGRALEEELVAEVFFGALEWGGGWLVDDDAIGRGFGEAEVEVFHGKACQFLIFRASGQEQDMAVGGEPEYLAHFQFLGGVAGEVGTASELDGWVVWGVGLDDDLA